MALDTIKPCGATEAAAAEIRPAPPTGASWWGHPPTMDRGAWQATVHGVTESLNKNKETPTDIIPDKSLKETVNFCDYKITRTILMVVAISTLN